MKLTNYQLLSGNKSEMKLTNYQLLLGNKSEMKLANYQLLLRNKSEGVEIKSTCNRTCWYICVSKNKK